MTDAEREAAIRDARRAAGPRYDDADTAVLLRQLDAARAEIERLQDYEDIVKAHLAMREKGTASLEEIAQKFGISLDENPDVVPSYDDLKTRAERAEARVAELETMAQSVGRPVDDAATVNYLEVVRLRGLLADAKARCAALTKDPPR